MNYIEIPNTSIPQSFLSTETIHDEIAPVAADAPDYSYSWKTKALIITTVALVVIEIIGIALIVTSLPPLAGLGLASLGLTARQLPVIFLAAPWIVMVGISAGLLVGIPLLLPVVTGYKAVENHRNEIKEREFVFAGSQTNLDVKLAYYSKAAEKGHLGALCEEYKIGKKLMLDALVEADAKKRMEQFEKGLAAVEKSAEHKNNLKTQKHLEPRPNLRESVKNKFKSAVEHGNQFNFDDTIELYWRNLVDKKNVGGILV